MTPAELNEAKKQLGITWDDLAEILGLSRRAVYDRQSGFRPVKMLEAEKIQGMLAEKTSKAKKKRKS